MTESDRLQRSSSLGFIHNFLRGKNERNGKTTFLLLHGTGANEDDLLPLAQMIDENASLLSPRGKALENGMPRYFRRLAEGVFDLEDLKFRTQELADFVSKASKQYEIDPRSIVALGYSNGANIAASLLLLRPESLHGAILFRAMLPLVPEKRPDLAGKAIFISGGRFDSMIPQSKTKELKELLEKSGAAVTMNWEESDHSLTRSDIEKARVWFEKNVVLGRK